MEDNLVDAKTMIKQDLIQKLGVILEGKIEEVAPSMISEKKDKDPAPETKEKQENKDLKKKRAVTNFAKKKDKEEIKDSVEHDLEDTDEDFEAFVDQIQEIVEEIEQETGEELTDDEIAMLGEQYLEFLSEESEN